MNGERNCAWMSGPKDATLTLPAAKWWLAISRGMLAKDYRRQTKHRPPVRCHMTPTFTSPLVNRP
jgi:hypothetical protein